MFHHISFYFLTLLIALIFLPASNVFAQRCIGATKYIVRDEKGEMMSLKEMEKLTFSFNGTALKLHKAPNDAELAYYEYEDVQFYDGKFRRQTEKIFLSNPLIFGIDSPCGKLGDLTVGSGGKLMKLFFDIGEHNTSYLIDSLPFQEGTFQLKSLGCKDGARPPMIDNLNAGNCFVSADNWKGMEKDWVRHLIWNDFSGGRIDTQGLDCRKKTIGVISTQKDWEAAWKFYREANRGNPLPAVDFRAEVVLTVFLPKAPPSSGYDSILVDKKGDLTFRRLPPPKAYDPDACSILLLIIYRSGVESIEGKPLPPPEPEE